MLDYIYFAATEEAEGGLAAFGIDPVAILIQSGTFVLFFIIIKKFALDKISKTLDERDETINEGLENAKKAERLSEEVAQKQEAVLLEARKQSDEIIAHAREESGVLVKEAEESAAARADKIVADAEAQIEAEITRARQELSREVTDLVAQATSALLEEKVDAKKDKELIESAIKRSRS